MTAELSDIESAMEMALASGVSFLSPMGPLVLASAYLGILQDTRRFAREFGLAHALVIRECVSLDAELGLLKIEDRGERSGRLFFQLSELGMDLFMSAGSNDTYRAKY